MEKTHRLNELKTAVLEDGVCSWTCISDEAFSRYEYTLTVTYMAILMSFLPLISLIIMIFTNSFSWGGLLSILGFFLLFMLFFAAITSIQKSRESVRIVTFRMNNNTILMSDIPTGSYGYKNQYRDRTTATVRFKKIRYAEPQPDHRRIILSQGFLNHIILLPEADFDPICEFILQRIDEAGRPD